MSFAVGNDHRFVSFHNGDARIRGPEVDSDYFTHLVHFQIRSRMVNSCANGSVSGPRQKISALKRTLCQRVCLLAGEIALIAPTGVSGCHLHEVQVAGEVTQDQIIQPCFIEGLVVAAVQCP